VCIHFVDFLESLPIGMGTETEDYDISLDSKKIQKKKIKINITNKQIGIYYFI